MRRSTQRYIACIAWLATGIQGEIGWWKYFNRALRKPRARKSRHYQVISWTSNGAASKSGTRFGHAQCIYVLNCDICLKTKITRASCRRRAGTVVPRAEHFGDLITADHKVLSEESESRNIHRYAVVVQDLAAQWMARGMGSPRHVHNRRRRTRKVSEPVCVQTTLLPGAHAGREGPINDPAVYRQVGVAKTSSETHRKKSRAARKGKWPPRGTGNRQAPPILEVRPGNRQGWWKRSSVRWDVRQLTLDKTVGSRVWWHTQGSSGRPALDLGWGSSKTTPGSLSTGSPAGRTPPHGDGSMYSQAYVRASKTCGSQLERSRPWSWTLKWCCGSGWARWVAPRRSLIRVERWSPWECACESGPRSRQGARRSQATIIPVYNKTLPRRSRRTWWSSWSRRGNQKSFTLTIPWNLASLARNYPGIIARQHHTDQKPVGLPKEQCAEWK